MRKHFLFAVIWSAIAESLTVTRKSKRYFSVNFIALIVAAVLSISPANAIMSTTLTAGARAIFTPQWRSTNVTQCAGYFTKEQLVVIDGKPVWVLVSQVYPTGPLDLSKLESCDEYNIYGVGSCGCLTEPLENVFPQKDEEKISIGTIEQEHVSFVSPTNSAGLLWIRTRNEK